MKKNALSVTREDNFAGWYQQVVSEADLAEESGVRGCMVMRPWGYGIWERVQYLMDQRIKAAGHENCYFPLFIPLSYFAKEAEHVDGFAKEMAVVTHHRLTKERDYNLCHRPTFCRHRRHHDLQLTAGVTNIGQASPRWRFWRPLIALPEYRNACLLPGQAAVSPARQRRWAPQLAGHHRGSTDKRAEAN